MKNGTEHDMTQGAVAVPLIGFTIPLVLGNFFQLFYNAVDSIIVGRYVGGERIGSSRNIHTGDESCHPFDQRSLYGGKYFDEFPVWSGKL